MLSPNISDDLTTPSSNLLSRLRKFVMASKILSNFYRCSVENVIRQFKSQCGMETALFQDRKALQHFP